MILLHVPGIWSEGFLASEWMSRNQAADQEHLFEPFVQLQGGLNRPYQGAGLGLVVAARLAELHGGRITVESVPGQGSRFTVTLPVQQAHE